MKEDCRPGHSPNEILPFYFGELEIPLPPRTAARPTGHSDKRWLGSVRNQWPRFCKLAIDEIRSSPPSPLLDLTQFTPEGLKEEFTLPKAILRKNLGIFEQEHARVVYHYFSLGREADNQENNQQGSVLTLTRLETFQLLVLARVHRQQVIEPRIKIFPPVKDNTEQMSQLMRRRPESGGPLMTAR